jgi:flagellar biosynthesis/type III secretory pathway chaperone
MTLEHERVLRHLDHWVAEESQLLAELESLLQTEHAMLHQDDIDALERIGRARQHCVQQLSHIDRERIDVCRRLSLGEGRPALARLHAWGDPSGALERRWLANLDVARRCRDVNDGNGAIVAAKLARVRHTLGALRGAAPPPVYSAKGARYGGITPREFGSA